MMTDLERFIELYRAFGVECVVNSGTHGSSIYFGYKYKDESYTPVNNCGLAEYYIFFDMNGKFQNHGLQDHCNELF